MVVILHNLRSAHNVGSIFRTSDGAGVKKIYLSGFSPSPVNKVGTPRIRLTKVALGAEKFIEWEQIKSITSTIKKLKKNGYKIYSVEQDKKSIPYQKIKKVKDEKIALIMGNEINGLTRNILDKSDKIIDIPMHGQKKSLNVSVAYGIVSYHFAQLLNKIND
ncbi:MAG: TrmH family RNA methyltransferase [Candidatus Paceibacterota bacterium]